MITWILIVLAHVGPMGQMGNTSLSSVPGFGSQQECQQAGAAAESLAKGTFLEVRFVCVKQTRP